MSFLEKLQKGIHNGPADAVPEDNAGMVASQNIEEIEPNEGMVVFASYKSASTEESHATVKNSTVKKTRPRGRPRKSITADNLEEIASTETKEPDKNETAAAQVCPQNIPQFPQKTMINKKLSNDDNTEGNWLNGEGQLTVDVYQTDNDLVLQSAIAGIKVEDLDVLIEDDVITIKGNRANPLDENGDYFIQECYWGPFSRKIILPVEVDSGRADATMKDGILTIRIPKIQREKKKKLTIKE